MAKANHLKTKETDAVVVTPQSTATVVHSGGGPTTSNFILVRAARSDSGQLILQNGHELLSLLNEASDGGGIGDGKPIVLQHQRIKTRSLSTDSTNITAVQPIIKSTMLEGTSAGAAGSGGGAIFLQSSSLKKSTLTTTTDGSIILQQRLTKAGTGDGPILLQTLKRLHDKTPSILVIRNAASTTAIPTTSTATTVATTKLPQKPPAPPSLPPPSQPASQRSLSEDRIVDRTSRHVSNIPLGSGK